MLSFDLIISVEICGVDRFERLGWIFKCRVKIIHNDFGQAYKNENSAWLVRMEGRVIQHLPAG